MNHLDVWYVALTWLFVSLSRVIGMEPIMLALVKGGNWNRSIPRAWIVRWLDRVWIRSIRNLLKRMSSINTGNSLSVSVKVLPTPSSFCTQTTSSPGIAQPIQRCWFSFAQDSQTLRTLPNIHGSCKLSTSTHTKSPTFAHLNAL